jgi:hypothetical protein
VCHDCSPARVTKCIHCARLIGHLGLQLFRKLRLWTSQQQRLDGHPHGRGTAARPVHTGALLQQTADSPIRQEKLAPQGLHTIGAERSATWPGIYVCCTSTQAPRPLQWLHRTCPMYAGEHTPATGHGRLRAGRQGIGAAALKRCSSTCTLLMHPGCLGRAWVPCTAALLTDICGGSTCPRSSHKVLGGGRISDKFAKQNGTALHV